MTNEQIKTIRDGLELYFTDVTFFSSKENATMWNVDGVNLQVEYVQENNRILFMSKDGVYIPTDLYHSLENELFKLEVNEEEYEINKQAESLWNKMLEKNIHFKNATEKMSSQSIDYLQGIFKNIIKLKDKQENNKIYLDIAIEHDDTESELYYQKIHDNIHDELKYLVNIVSEYVNQYKN